MKSPKEKLDLGLGFGIWVWGKEKGGGQLTGKFQHSQV